jgi:cytochrome c-type biogenesis protein CcmE
VTSAPGDAAAPLAPVAPPRRNVQARGRFFVVVTLLCAAVAVLLYKGLLSSLDYYQTVDYALTHRAQLGTSSFRLEGVVVGGTVHATDTGAAFSLSGANCQRVRVVNQGSPPQLFQPGIPVVVVGRFASATSNVFLSNQIMVKHSATYIAAHPGRVTPPANGC